MKIAFVGDSFCMNAGPSPHPYPDTDDEGCVIAFSGEMSKSDHKIQNMIRNSDKPVKLLRTEGEYDWPWIVANQLDADIIQSGYGGKHFIMPAIDFIPYTFDADIIIFCVSEPYRFVNKHNLPINLIWIKQMIEETGNNWNQRYETADKHDIPLSEMKNVAQAADMYYKHLFDQSAAELFQISLVSFIDNLMKQHNKKTIWFPCFKQSLQLPGEYWKPELDPERQSEIAERYHAVTNQQYIPVSGPSINIPLHELSQAELRHEGNTPDEITYKTQNDRRRNHFNKENNHKIAELILNIVKTDSFLPGVIKMEDYFSYMNLDDAISVRT